MKEILITSSVLIAVLLVLRLIFAKKVRRTWIYGAWVLVALRLLIPVQVGQLDFSILSSAKPVTEAITQVVEKPVSGQTKEEVYTDIVVDYIEKDPSVFIPEVQEQIREETQQGTINRQEILDKIQQKHPEKEIFVPEVQQQVQQQVEQTADPITLGQIATTLWLAGVAAMAVWFAIVNLRHSHVLKRTGRKLDAESPIPVYISEKVGSPCLVGLFRPVVYLTPESAENPVVRRHVLTHELTHYRHKDHIWSLVRCVCLCVYWFHPLVWVAAWFSRRDCELACDEGALMCLGENERIAYGESLLDVVSRASRPANLMRTATAMNETKKQLKERVNFIVKKRKISLIAGIAMVLVCAIVAGCAAAGPTTAENPIVDATVPTTRPTTPTTPTTQPTVPTEPEVPTKTVYLITGIDVSAWSELDEYTETFTYGENGQMVQYTYQPYPLDEPFVYPVEVDVKEHTMKVYAGESLYDELLYDELGHLIRYIQYSGGRIFTDERYGYNANGRLHQKLTYQYRVGDYANGELESSSEEIYTYDQNGRLESKNCYGYPFGEPVVEAERDYYLYYRYVYHYDESGRLSRMDTYDLHHYSGKDIDSYTLYEYDEANRTITENIYDTVGNATSGYHEVLDTVRIVRYDENQNVTYVEERDAIYLDDYKITNYTYQAVQLPLDVFTLQYVTVPDLDFYTGSTGDRQPLLSQEDQQLYQQAVAALEQYVREGQITYTDRNGTHTGQDAFWAICQLFVRLEGYGQCDELLQNFQVKYLLREKEIKYAPTASDNYWYVTKNKRFNYDEKGVLQSMWCDEVFENFWLTEDTFLVCRYEDGKLVGYSAYEEEGGFCMASATFYYDEQGRRIRGEMGSDQMFEIVYSYDDAGRLSKWYFVDMQDSLTEMTYTYDQQGRLLQTVQSHYMADMLLGGPRKLGQTITKDYSYDEDGLLQSIVITDRNYWNGEVNDQVLSTVTFRYDNAGNMIWRGTRTGAMTDLEGNVLYGSTASEEWVYYTYEAWLVYEP